MNNTNKISQLELFSGSSEKQNILTIKKRPLLRDMTLTIENSIIGVVIILMALVLFFSLGVERGKILAMGSVNPVRKIAVAEEKKADIMGHSASVNNKNRVAQETISSKKALHQEQPLEPMVEPQPKINEILENFYTIQVASFKQKHSAEKEALKIKNNLGHETFVVSKGNYLIVCVGKFVKKDEAQLIANRLKSKYTDYYIRRL